MEKKSALSIAATSPVRTIFITAAAMLPCIALIAAFVGGGAISSAIVSMAFLAFGYTMGRSQPSLFAIGAAVALIGQAIAFTMAFQGHPWQIDSHMLFFALLACLVGLRSIPALIGGAVVIAVHHVSLTVFMPSLVYPSGGFIENIERTAIHAVIVVFETVALVIVVRELQHMNKEMETKADELEQSLKLSDASRQDAHLSQKDAVTAKEEAQAAKEKAELSLARLNEAETTRLSLEAHRQKNQEIEAERDLARTQEQAAIVDALRLGLAQLEAGDLTTRIVKDFPAQYEELKDGFNTAVQSLEDMVSEVASRSTQMDFEIHEISTSTDHLARQTEDQAMTLSNISKALKDLTKTVNDNVRTVAEVNTSSQDAQSSASKSGDVVSDASVAMEAIQGGSQEISKIIEVIDAISFQTNLLALNAGVEAARAGESGRGFAVIASEVRALAQRSSESATDIRALINRSESQVAKGSQKIADTVSALKEVVAAVLGTTSKMDVIAQSSQTQSVEISTLNSSISDLGSATQLNAAKFEETNAACINLAKSATALRELTQKFQTSGTETRKSKVA
ncbi:methyl-accepting chemotaxis protein [Sulfitobacter sp.]|uniref:methyl-accepting chemotaxis protein n=1 Tax=Sulfitobacter sp. TaxID=1903071 RepID=UPI003F6C0159